LNRAAQRGDTAAITDKRREETMAKAAAKSKSKTAGRSAATARAKTPAKRRPAPAAKPRAAAPRRKPQTFTVSHARDSEFKADGLRPYARYRDLGIAAASRGLCLAHVIRMIPPVTDEVRKRHYHETELQLIYVLKGWMKNEFEGHGEQLMEAGSCWLQPPKIKHTVLDYSDDLEVLEIIVPADFKTVDLTK
jgi:mannose-6-phosphate isomerase-like protein (cupin superfamily)